MTKRGVTAINRAPLNNAYEMALIGAQLIEAKEEESARISRELHDELGQILTSMKIGISLLVRRSEKEAHAPEYVLRLRNMQSLANEAIRSVKRITKDLRPLMLDEIGLIGAIDSLIERHRDTTQIHYEFSHRLVDEAFDRSFSTAVYRIVQESLTNVVRHAEASCVKIQMNEADGWLDIVIADNGIGFNLEQSDLQSLGISGMRERARIFGGEVIVMSKPKVGTTVRLSVPIRD